MPKAVKYSDPVPVIHDWRTSDEEELSRRRLRAETEVFRISNLDRRHPIFSNFSVGSPSGLTYSVEIRDLAKRQFACDCIDFRINGLGSCKHVEAVLLHLEGRYKRKFVAAARTPSPRVDLVPDVANGSLRLVGALRGLPVRLRRYFGSDGCLKRGTADEITAELARLAESELPQLRVSQEVAPWLEARRRSEERRLVRREYERRVQSGEWPVQETKVPLYPYQREGMLHLAFTERALLADEMGLGKTIQAIAACALLHRLGKVQRVLVVTPASLKSEWEEQIQRFTELPYLLVFGQRQQRVRAYECGTFFTLVNYEQMLADALEVNARLHPDVVILDEAQRIKNWNTKTSRAIKRLRSRYAFVLTGTPIENRIDELHSLMDFLEPSVLGPLFRFNREYYELNERGRPEGYRNLHQLHERIRPFMLRRRKADVETELPDRTDRHLFVPLSPSQRATYADHELMVTRLAHLARRRPLTQQESDKLLRHLAMMRMVCDTNFILDPEDRVCPKLGEIEKLLESCRENDAKVIVFSECERMLLLVRETCEKLGIGFAWHTGSVPQRRRRAEINAFKQDPACRVFLSTESGATGLNLQNARVVINCDLPWNPARLEQRIARAWRKHQTQAVTVYHLIAENTIEHRMIETLSDKRTLADGVLDLQGDLTKIKIASGRQAFLSKLEQLITSRSGVAPAKQQPLPPVLPVDRALGFAEEARRCLNGSLVSCEERFPREGSHSVLYVVVDGNSGSHRARLSQLHEAYFGPGRSDPLAPVQLEIVDRATDEALRRLTALGLVQNTTRGARPLLVDDSQSVLTDEQRRRAGEHRAKADHFLKLTRVLAGAGFDTEARVNLSDAVRHIACALAIENRMEEPGSLAESLLPPYSRVWNEAFPVLQRFAAEPEFPWEPVADALKRLIDSSSIT